MTKESRIGQITDPLTKYLSILYLGVFSGRSALSVVAIGDRT
jgi:hypothetical protein